MSWVSGQEQVEQVTRTKMSHSSQLTVRCQCKQIVVRTCGSILCPLDMLDAI